MSTSTGSEFDTEDNESWPNPPYTYFLAPLLVLILIALVVTLFQIRRRREARRAALNQTTLRIRQNPAGAWSVQTGRRIPGSVAQRGGAAAAGRDPASDVRIEVPRPTRARGLRWVLRPAPVRDEEEGLNELGEAPPPYEPPPKKDGGDVELDDLGRGNAAEGNATGASAAAEPRPPDYGADAGEANARSPSAGGAGPGAAHLPLAAASPSGWTR